ncbi:MAG: RluA family pseudouridine synthase [Oscillospiraceae bacterium]|nr:RluA family pseudouridine synthase [Oscillospiraceae bacterium]
MTCQITAEQAGERIDRSLALIWPYSRSMIQSWLDAGLVTVNGKTAARQQKLRGGDLIFADIPEPEPDRAGPEDIPLEIVYEDADLLVVNKPKGMVVHPAAGHRSGTLVNALLAYCGDSLSGIGGVLRPGIVHRLDKDTSGLLLAAKNDRAHQGLAEQIKARTVLREYEAVVVGHLKQPEGKIDAPIGRDPLHRQRMAVTEKNSREAVTRYTVLAEYPGNSGRPKYSHLRLRLETGRTHQIRVHMAHIGHPVAGDPVYGSAKGLAFLGGQCLHARTVGFTHPVSGEEMRFESRLPGYFVEFLRELGVRS